VGGHMGALGTFEGDLQNCFGHFQQIINTFLESLAQAQSIGTLAPLLGDLFKGGGLGALSQKCMECPQAGRRGEFRQITSY